MNFFVQVGMAEEVGVELARRPLESGFSYVDLYVQDDALVLHEEDTGTTPGSIFGRDLDYYLSVKGSDRLRHLQELLAVEGDQDLAGPLDEAGLRRLGDVMLKRFGSDLDLVKNYRDWLTAHGIEHSVHVI